MSYTLSCEPFSLARVQSSPLLTPGFLADRAQPVAYDILILIYAFDRGRIDPDIHSSK